MNTLRRKLFLVFSTVLLSFAAAPEVSGQWVQLDGPSYDVSSFLTKDSDFFAATYGGIYLTTNSGASWVVVDSGLTNTYVTALITCGTNIFAGTERGIFYSTNNGVSWEMSSINFTDHVFNFAVIDTNLFVGTDDGVYISTNNGESWKTVNNGLPATDVYALAVSGTNLFAGTISSGIFLSTNNGGSWIGASDGLNDSNILVLTPMGANLFAGTNGGSAFISTNNGFSWTSTQLASANAFAVSGSFLFAGTDEGVFLTTNDGVEWEDITGYLNDTISTYINSIAINDTSLFISTQYNGIFRRPLSDFNQSSVAENTTANSSTTLSVFPNPASVELQIIGEQLGEVHLFDLVGRERMNAVTNGPTTTLDVSSLEPGMYFLREGNESAKVEIER
jgi:ligand-binding sensor domain-containing protein